MPHTTGEEWPGPTATFQERFFAGPNSTGILEFCEMPDPFGPRNCGQSSASAENQHATKIASDGPFIEVQHSLPVLAWV